MKKILKTVFSVADRIDRDEIFVYAAQSSFYIIIAAIPFLMLFIETLKFFLPITEAEAVLMMKAFVPPMLGRFVEVIASELFSRSATVLSVTGIAAVWSASRGIAAIERGMKKVYKTEPSKNIIVGVGFSILHTFIFIIALVATLLLMVFGGTILGFLTRWIPWIGEIAGTVDGFTNITYFIMMFAIFTFIYRLSAGRGVRLRDQVWGALFSTMGWFLFSFFFSIYIENFSNHSYIYGSLAMIVIFMLWLYFCMIILLLGAEVNVYVKNRAEKRKGSVK